MTTTNSYLRGTRKLVTPTAKGKTEMQLQCITLFLVTAWGCLLATFALEDGFDKKVTATTVLGHFPPDLITRKDVIYSNDTCLPAGNEKYRSCACTITRTNEVINLNGILKNTNCTAVPGGCKVPRFVVEGTDKWEYAYHPCFPFNIFLNDSHVHAGDRACKQVAAARYTTESAHVCDSLGTQSSFQFSTQSKSNYVVSNLGLKFTSAKFSAFVSLVCNFSVAANKSRFGFLGIDNHQQPTYFMSLESSCCCPGGCNVTFSMNPENGKPSKGFWAIIGLVIGIVVVLIITLIVIKVHGKKRKDPERERLIEPVA